MPKLLQISSTAAEALAEPRCPSVCRKREPEAKAMIWMALVIIISRCVRLTKFTGPTSEQFLQQLLTVAAVLLSATLD